MGTLLTTNNCIDVARFEEYSLSVIIRPDVDMYVLNEVPARPRQIFSCRQLLIAITAVLSCGLLCSLALAGDPAAIIVVSGSRVAQVGGER